MFLVATDPTQLGIPPSLPRWVSLHLDRLGRPRGARAVPPSAGRRLRRGGLRPPGPRGVGGDESDGAGGHLVEREGPGFERQNGGAYEREGYHGVQVMWSRCDLGRFFFGPWPPSLMLWRCGMLVEGKGQAFVAGAQ